MFSTSEKYHDKCKGYTDNIMGGLVHWRDFLSTLGGYNTISIPEDVNYVGGYHEYSGGCPVHRGKIMAHVGELIDW